jgi:hypothetical protein
MRASKPVASDRLLAVPTTAGFEESRMNPSCVSAQVTQRFGGDSDAMAAAWN